MGTIDFYHLKPLSLTLTLDGNYKLSTKQNHLASFSRTLFNKWNEIWLWWSSSSWTSWSRETAILLWLYQNTFNVGMHSDIYTPIWLKLDAVVDTTELSILILVFVTLTLIQGHRDARKQKLLYQFFPTIMNAIKACSYLINVTFFLYFIFKREHPTFCPPPLSPKKNEQPNKNFHIV